MSADKPTYEDVFGPPRGEFATAQHAHEIGTLTGVAIRMLDGHVHMVRCTDEIPVEVFQELFVDQFVRSHIELAADDKERLRTEAIELLARAMNALRDKFPRVSLAEFVMSAVLGGAFKIKKEKKGGKR